MPIVPVGLRGTINLLPMTGPRQTRHGGAAYRLDPSRPKACTNASTVQEVDRRDSSGRPPHPAGSPPAASSPGCLRRRRRAASFARHFHGPRFSLRAKSSATAPPTRSPMISTVPRILYLSGDGDLKYCWSRFPFPSHSSPAHHPSPSPRYGRHSTALPPTAALRPS